MKKLLSFVVLLLSYTHVYAQLDETEELKKKFANDNKDTVAWVYGGTMSIGLNQGFLHNWPAGGELASLTVNGIFSGYLNRIYHRTVWSNNLDMTYSLLYAYSNDFIPRKIDDRIDFTSKYGVRIDTSKDFFVTGLFNFKSQFTKGYDYEVENFDSFSTSDFLSPAYFTLALGLEYRKGTNLSLFLSPVAARVTTASKYYTTRDEEGAFGVQYGKTSRFELGAYFSGRYQVDVSKNMTFKTRVDLYSNYLAKDVTDSTGRVVKKNNPGNIDILFDNLLSWKMNKYVTLVLAATFIYDNDIPYDRKEIDPNTGMEIEKDELGVNLGWTQIKEVFTFGFQYKF